MPHPYNIIFGRDTALPSPLYYSSCTSLDYGKVKISTPESVTANVCSN